MQFFIKWIVTAKQSNAMIVMCRKSKEMNNKIYDLKISLLGEKIMIEAKDESQSNPVNITIPSKKSQYTSYLIGKKIINAFKGDYELLLDKLRIRNNKLVIIAPEEEELRINSLPH